MFGGQHFQDFARSQGSNVDLDEILRQMFGQAGGFSRGCRLERSRQWAVCCMHEASLYDFNSFVTLTYNDENLPEFNSLDYRHFQLFMKRLRKEFAPTNIRFYMCGEYGEDFEPVDCVTKLRACGHCVVA